MPLTDFDGQLVRAIRIGDSGEDVASDGKHELLPLTRNQESFRLPWMPGSREHRGW